MNFWIKIFALQCVRSLIKVLWVFPINHRKILFMSYNGLKYNDSPKSISDLLIENDSNLLVVWAFRDTNIELTDINSRIKIAYTGSFSYFFHIVTSQIIVVNDYLSSYIPIRRNQVLLNTWHGGGSYKTVGMTAKSPSKYDKYFYTLHAKMTRAFVSSSSYFESTVLERSFLFAGDVIKCGLPRNDILFKRNDHIPKKVRDYFDIGGNKKLVLYAPTYRDISAKDNRDNPVSYIPININMTLEALEKRFGGIYCFLYRAHHIDKHFNSNDNCYDATSYPDTQELLVAADALISDYSSTMWDYSLTKKPCFVYAPDIDEYVGARDFFMDIHKWPYPIAESNEELYQKISKFDLGTYTMHVTKYLEMLGSHESGCATNTVVEKLIKYYGLKP